MSTLTAVEQSPGASITIGAIFGALVGGLIGAGASRIAMGEGGSWPLILGGAGIGAVAGGVVGDRLSAASAGAAPVATPSQGGGSSVSTFTNPAAQATAEQGGVSKGAANKVVTLKLDAQQTAQSVSAPAGANVEVILPTGASWVSQLSAAAALGIPSSGSSPVVLAMPSSTTTVTVSWLDQSGTGHNTSVTFAAS